MADTGGRGWPSLARAGGFHVYVLPLASGRGQLRRAEAVAPQCQCRGTPVLPYGAESADAAGAAVQRGTARRCSPTDLACRAGNQLLQGAWRGGRLVPSAFILSATLIPTLVLGFEAYVPRVQNKGDRTGSVRPLCAAATRVAFMMPSGYCPPSSGH